MLVRSWNLFHGNTLPPRRRAYLREMVELVTADRPDVVCLQEVPAWALTRVGAWADMHVVPALARHASLGPLPIPAELGRALTAPHHGVIRSAFAGQGNAVLVARERRVVAHAELPLPAPEPRVAQRVDLDGLVVVNVHFSNPPRGDNELAAVLEWVGDAGPLVIAGDFNTTPRLDGFTGTLPGIDQVLVRGADAHARVWPTAERELGELVLSDHAPVEAEF